MYGLQPAVEGFQRGNCSDKICISEGELCLQWKDKLDFGIKKPLVTVSVVYSYINAV